MGEEVQVARPEASVDQQPPRVVSVVVASSRVGHATIHALLASQTAALEVVASEDRPLPNVSSAADNAESTSIPSISSVSESSHPAQQRTPSVVVRAVLRDASKADPAWGNHPTVEIVAGFDSNDPSTHGPAFENAEKALIIAPQLENRDEIIGRILGSAAAQGVRHVVLIGGVFQEEEKFVFHRQWMSCRRHAEQLGLAWTQLECSDFMENLLGSARTIKEEGKIHGVCPHGLSSPIAINDIGRAAAAILLEPSDKYHNRALKIVGPELLTPLQIADMASAVLQRPVQFAEMSVEEAEERAVSTGRMAVWQAKGFYDWVRLYFSTGRLATIQTDLPHVGVENPITFRQWLTVRTSLFNA